MSYISAKELAQAMERAEKEMGGNPVRETCEKIYAGVLKDSGERRQFESGAVRDIQRGKGRCDLLPLDVVSMIFMSRGERQAYEILEFIDKFINSGDVINLRDALHIFANNGQYQGCYPHLFLELAIHFEDGAVKYGENNWQKGIPVNCYIDSAVRHYLKYLRGDTDERHDRAFVWNIVCAIWTCIHMPELNPYGESAN